MFKRIILTTFFILFLLTMICCDTNSIHGTDDDTIETPVVEGTVSGDGTTPTWTWDTISNAIIYRYFLSSETEWHQIIDTTYTPSTPLGAGNYTLYVQAGKISSGSYIWSESGSATVTLTAGSPYVVSATPIDGQSVSDPAINIVVVFSEAMGQVSTESAFSMNCSVSGSMTGTYSWNAGGDVLTFDPTSNLLSGDECTFTIEDTATNTGGTPLYSTYTSIFTVE